MSVLAARLTAQLLSGDKARTAGEVVERLLAVQAQDFKGAHLALRPRSTGLVAGDLDAALNAGELVVSWLNRGTLHLVRAEDHAWLHALTTPQLATANRTRLAQEGVSTEQAERGVRAVERALHDGPKTRAQLKEVLVRERVPVARQALVHVLFLASLRGTCVRGPVVGREQAFVLARDWLPRIAAVDRDRALGELGRRYLAAHAAADDRDLAKWAGITLTDARRALAETRAPDVEVAPLPPPVLLGPFEELLMGWQSRDLVLGTNEGVVTKNGIFHPVALVRGKAVATWSMARDALTLTPFGVLPAGVERALERDAADVRRFLQG